ncbi:MAG: thioredoxin [Defluviitaleaceae bacterium]|nr:thioredoxin [Defluviitaleaceae bacterium]
MKPITVTKSNFEAEVASSEKPVLLDFWAAWCRPCVMLAPIIDELAAEVDYVKIGKVNVEEEPELSAAFGAMSIPLLVVTEKGAVVKQHVGMCSKDRLLEMVEGYR